MPPCIFALACGLYSRAYFRTRHFHATEKSPGSQLHAGNFSSCWLGIAIVSLMTIAYAVSTTGLGGLMAAPAVFAFGLVAFGFLGMGPVTIAVDSYGPVTDNAQSVFELSLIEQVPGEGTNQERARL
jgi:K(+)-stimulated pyrophosphate-energized sodium pump